VKRREFITYFTSMWRRGADYTAKILRGSKPADLPVEQATKFEMVVSLKTAKAILSCFRLRSCCVPTR